MSETAFNAAVFPGSGSFGGELRPLIDELASAAWLVRYPGRVGKDFGTPAGSYKEVIDACVTQVQRRAPTRPLLVGHSYGAYVAYSTAAALEALGIEVGALAVLGADAPALHSVSEQATGSRADTAAYLEGIDPGLLVGAAAEEWRDVVLDTTAQDLRLLGEFTGAEHPPVNCPILAARGEDDPLNSTESISAWSDITTAGCTVRVFPGGHSELLRLPEFASWLRTAAASPRTA